MSEGELKKQIQRLFSLYPENWEIYSVREKFFKDLMKISDEAKQDILGWWKQHPRYLAEKQKEGDYVDLDAFYRARDDWLYKLEKKLKKWFGGVSESE